MSQKTTLLLLAYRAEYLKKEYENSDRITFESVEDKHLMDDFVKVTIHEAITPSDLLSFIHAGINIGSDSMAKNLRSK
jgi:hypothetical protein